MSYVPGIPQGNQKPSTSRAQIAENFTQLNSQYGSSGDHVQFDAGTNNGKHKRSVYVAGSDVTTSSAEGSVYTKDAGAGRIELYYRRESNGTILPLSLVKAFAVFDSAGALQNSFNVSSITVVATGKYVVNFSSALANANYGVLVSCPMSNTFTVGGFAGYDSRTTTTVQVNIRALTTATGSNTQPISVLILGV